MQCDRGQQRNRERRYLCSQSGHGLTGPEKRKRLVNKQTRLPSRRRRSEGPGGILECFHQGLVEPPFPKSKLRKPPKDETIHQLLNAILGEIGCTQGGTATKFRAFQCLHLNQSLNKCQVFLRANVPESGRESTQMHANKKTQSHINADLKGWASTSCTVYENTGLNRLIRPIGA
jgi:hypothetical protein